MTRRPVAFLLVLIVAAALSVLVAVGGAAPQKTTAAPASPGRPDAKGSAANWPTYDRSAGRGGVSSTTPPFTRAANVVRAWAKSVDGAVYAQPLVVGNTVIVATEDDSVYAFNLITGRRLWRHHLATPVNGAALPCGDINPSGITGTPVVEVRTGRIWVVTFSEPRPGSFGHTLWELRLSNGRTVASRDIDPPGSIPANQQERGALTIVGSKVLVPFGGLDGDCAQYHGWVMGAPLSGHGALVHFETPTQREAAIWAPPGPVSGHNSVYVATGNGTPVNRVDDSDSVVRLAPSTLKVLSTFTPSDFVTLSADDLDLGSTSPALVSGDVFQIGKQGVGYVLGPVRLGGIGGQLASRQLCSGGFGGDAVSGSTVVVSCFDGLVAVSVRGGAHPRITPRWSVANIPAGPPVIAGGVVWDVTRADKLMGFRLSTGRQVFSRGTAPVVTSFPSLSASGGRLLVPEGHEVVCLRGA